MSIDDLESQRAGVSATKILTYMMTSSNGNIFALLALCAGNSPVTGEFSTQRPVTRSFDVFFDLRLSKRLCKQSRRRRFETSSHPLWRHCNELMYLSRNISKSAPEGQARLGSVNNSRNSDQTATVARFCVLEFFLTQSRWPSWVFCHSLGC